MANKQAIAPGFPFPVYVNETQTKQRFAPGVYVDETVSSGAATTPWIPPQQGSDNLMRQITMIRSGT